METFLHLVNQNFLVLLLFLAIALDMLSGIIAAGVEGRLASAISFDKMGRKLQIIFVPAVGAIVETAIARGLGQQWPVAGYTTLYCISTEAISILENVGRTNPKYLPAFLKDALSVLRDKAGKGNLPGAGGGDNK